MDLETAHRINSDTVKFVLAGNVGLGEPADISKCSLMELIEAKNMVKADNDVKMKNPGGQTMPIICDDRIIAAAYAFNHWHPSREPILHLHGKAIAVINLAHDEVDPDAE